MIIKNKFNKTMPFKSGHKVLASLSLVAWHDVIRGGHFLCDYGTSPLQVTLGIM